MKYLLSLFLLLLPSFAYAGEGATLLFQDGSLVYIRDGYKQIVLEMKALEKNAQGQKILELNLDGNSFLVNLSHIAIVCRDRCNNVQFSSTESKK
ncbi:MAG: hypothetical protein KDD55_01245 [Bdellovibrionales bacterium]|nr:hypothetical protein [Bdellovibrionales bacterium]